MRNIAFSLLMLALLIVTTPARAETRITEQAIRAMYAKSQAVMKGTINDFIADREAVMADTFILTTVTNITAPGQRPMQEKNQRTKQFIIENSRAYFDSVRPATINNRIKSISISPDGKTAHVTDITTMNGAIPDKAPGMIANMVGSCSDVLKLNNKGVLQLVSSNCTNNMLLMRRM